MITIVIMKQPIINLYCFRWQRMLDLHKICLRYSFRVLLGVVDIVLGREKELKTQPPERRSGGQMYMHA